MKEIAVIQFARGEIGRPFIWGETDCASLVIRAFDRIGVHIAPCEWVDEASARSRMSAELPSDRLKASGFVEIPVSDASVGDVLIGTADGWPECLHLVVGNSVLSSSVSNGVTLHSLRSAIAACNRALRHE